MRPKAGASVRFSHLPTLTSAWKNRLDKLLFAAIRKFAAEWAPLSAKRNSPICKKDCL
jgi:hypothetical protein